jgi:two-component sensor histidine kinase
LDRVIVANFVVFSASSLAIIWLALVHRQLAFDLEDKERERQILAGEIHHRSKNLVSVIGSLVRQ